MTSGSRLVAATLLATAAAAPFPALQAQQQKERPFAAFSASAENLRDSLVAMARSQLGKRYRLGGRSPTGGFDCSGFVQYVLGRLQLSAPRTVTLQATLGLPLGRDTSELLPGDLLTFGKDARGSVSHIGIYVGNGRYIHASSVAGRVIESAIDRPRSPLIKVWSGARRLVDFGETFLASADSTKPRG